MIRSDGSIHSIRKRQRAKVWEVKEMRREKMKEIHTAERKKREKNKQAMGRLEGNGTIMPQELLRGVMENNVGELREERKSKKCGVRQRKEKCTHKNGWTRE